MAFLTTTVKGGRIGLLAASLTTTLLALATLIFGIVLVLSSSTKKESSDLPESIVSVPRARTTLEDVFISVKTSEKFHDTRLKVILKTWFGTAKQQVSDENLLLSAFLQSVDLLSSQIIH